MTVFVYSDTLLFDYPHPLELLLILIFLIPSLFPPYNAAVLGYFTIDVLLLISFIFRGIAFRQWSHPSMDAINLLLNSRTLLSFLPLLQTINIVLITFHLPSREIVLRIIYPLLPTAFLLLLGFFLTLHFLGDEHISPQVTLDTLLRTLLLNIHPGRATQFHPVAARMVYFLLGFASLYLFFGLGVIGRAVHVILDTDWQVDYVRWKARRLIQYTAPRKVVRKKRLLGRGRVLSSMPFNVVECMGVVSRMSWMRNVAFYISVFNVVFVWNIAVGVVALICWIRRCVRYLGSKVIDEYESEMDGDMDEERTGLLLALETED
jgi:hypothetical protein